MFISFLQIVSRTSTIGRQNGSLCSNNRTIIEGRTNNNWFDQKRWYGRSSQFAQKDILQGKNKARNSSVYSGFLPFGRETFTMLQFLKVLLLEKFHKSKVKMIYDTIYVPNFTTVYPYNGNKMLLISYWEWKRNKRTRKKNQFN